MYGPVSSGSTRSTSGPLPSRRSAGWYVDLDTPGTPVHEVDIADVAAAALMDDRHAGKAYNLAGPEALTHRDQIAAIAAAIGEPLRVDEVEPEEAREFYRAQGGWAAENADFLFGFEDYSGATTDPTEATFGVGRQDGGQPQDGERPAGGEAQEQTWEEPDIPLAHLHGHHRRTCPHLRRVGPRRAVRPPYAMAWRAVRARQETCIPRLVSPQGGTIPHRPASRAGS